MPRPWLVLLALAALGRSAAAEINMADSVEWMTADADAVVVGTIASSTVTPSDDHTVWAVATIDVTATLKGAAAKRVTFAVQTDASGVPAGWLGHEAVFFLVKSDRRAHDSGCVRACHYDRAAWALRRGVDDGVVTLDAKAGEEVYTAAFTALRARADVVAAVKAAASSKATRAINVDVPWDSDASHALYAGSAVWMYIPIDAAAEARAVAWIADASVNLRVQGVRVLAERRSAATIRRLKALLADPGFATVTESGKPTIRRYLVRQAADAALTAWKVAHAAPTIDEPLLTP
ncbi:MAG: hypothetical protein K8W52_17985 [Deltaproteobacteria bacterium]|nr:hypothetical protein [Deltaproteobacteria bacterium]